MTDKEWKNNYFNEIIHHIDDDGLFDNMVAMKKVILKVRKNNRKVIFAGNGTSSLTATRGAMALLTQLGVKTYSINEPAFITAAGNDFGYENIFTRYVNLYAEKGDVIVLISASGKSKNLVSVPVVAHKKGCTVITFTGFEVLNPLNKAGDINFWTPCKDYSRTESIHSVWMAMVCDFIAKDEKHKIGIHGIEF